MLHRRVLPGLVLLAVLGACRRPPPILAVLPDFHLTAVSAGRPAAGLTLAELKGRPWVAGFVFTRCAGPCPAITAAMAGLQKSLPPRFGLLSVSVDPAYDTPAVLEKYAAKFGADPSRWLFATGSPAVIADLLIGGFKVPFSGATVTHTTRLVLIDAEGRVRGYFDSETADGLDALRAAAASL